MGALIMFTLVIVIANVGGFYFYFQDKKEQQRNVWGIERSGFFNGREKWAKGFENQMV